MPAALAVIAGWVGQFFTGAVARYLAYKALIILIVAVLLPIVLNNFLYKIIEIFVNYAQNQNFSGNMIQPMVLGVTGLMAYVVDALNIPEALSIYLTAVSIKFLLKILSFRNLFITKFGM